ncbi:MAG: hypothetical protein ACI9DC_000268 [Gammaproteobacteria bacterium]
MKGNLPSLILDVKKEVHSMPLTILAKITAAPGADSIAILTMTPNW